VSIDPLELSCWLVCAAGTAGCLLGLLGLLAADRLRPSWTALVALVAVGLAGDAAAGYVRGVPAVVWLPVAGLASLAAAAVAAPVVRFPLLVRACREARDCLAGPRGQGIVLLVGGAGLFWAGAVLLDAGVPEDLSRFDVHRVAANPPLREVVPCPAVTDRGRPLRLATAVLTTPDAAPPESSDRLRERGSGGRLIQTAPPDPAYDCHGWVFTGGRYWLLGTDVERVLADNGYREVASPAVDDLAVVRLPDGSISHTGLVRVATAGLVLVESKWGSQGRYVHRPEDAPYVGRWCYYRSARRGHLLRGLPDDPPGPPARAP
jgi:hypothetical protein